MKKEADQLLTVMGYHHTGPPEDVSVINLSKPCGWLKIIHERNARSGMRGRPVFSKNVLKFFNLPGGFLEISFMHSAAYVLSRVSKRYLSAKRSLDDTQT